MYGNAFTSLPSDVFKHNTALTLMYAQGIWTKVMGISYDFFFKILQWPAKKFFTHHSRVTI